MLIHLSNVAKRCICLLFIDATKRAKTLLGWIISNTFDKEACDSAWNSLKVFILDHLK